MKFVSCEVPDKLFRESLQKFLNHLHQMMSEKVFNFLSFSINFSCGRHKMNDALYIYTPSQNFDLIKSSVLHDITKI